MSGDDLTKPQQYCDWHEDIGDVLWWRSQVSEAPYVGSPLHFGATWSVGVYNGRGEIEGERSDHQFQVGAWPFTDDDIPHLWWTPLPDGKLIEDQIPL